VPFSVFAKLDLTADAPEQFTEALAERPPEAREPQPVPGNRWADFFRERRLLPLLRTATDSGHLPPVLAAEVEQLRQHRGRRGHDRRGPLLAAAVHLYR
jgi:hypothetical protein